MKNNGNRTIVRRTLGVIVAIAIMAGGVMLPAKRVYATNYANVEMGFNFDEETGNLSSITVEFDISGASASVANGKWGIGIFECDFTDDDNEKNRVKSEYGLTDINVVSGGKYNVNAYNAARVAPPLWTIQQVCTTPYTVDKSALMPLPVAYGAGVGAWSTTPGEHHKSTIDMSGANLQPGKTYYAHIMMNNGKCWFVESSGTKGYSGNTFSLDTLHSHHYVYGASDNVLYAYCDASKARAYCDNYGEANKVSITLSAENQAYSGSPYAGASLGDTSAWSGLGFAVPTIEYVGRGSTTYNKSTQPPTMAGTYTASISAGGYTVTKDFEITKCEQNATVTVSGYIYGGSVSTPSIAGVKEDAVPTFYYNSENSNENGTAWSELTSTTLVPGTYYAYATLPATKNYNAYTTPLSTFTVSPKSVYIEWSNTEVIYNGMDQAPTVKCSDGDIIPGDSVTATVSESKKNAGTYTISAAIDNTNYTIKEGSQNHDFTITKKELGIYPANQTISKGASIQSDINAILTTGLCESDDLGTLFGANEIKVACKNTSYDQPGNYVLELVIADGKELDNYSIIKGEGKLTVKDEPSGGKVYPEEENSGEVYFEVQEEPGLPVVNLGSIDLDTVKKLANDEEEAAVKDGSDLLVYLELKDASQNVSDEEKDKFKAIISSGYTLAEDNILDISLYKRLFTDNSYQEPSPIYELDKEIEVTVELPSELLPTSSDKIRKYEVCREHEGTEGVKYEVIDSTYKDGKITFKTNLFSDYAIAYIEMDKPNPKPTPGPNPPGGNDNPGGNGGSASSNASGVTTIIPVIGAPYMFEAPKTGDSDEIVIFAGLLLAGMVMIFARKNKKA